MRTPDPSADGRYDTIASRIASYLRPSADGSGVRTWLSCRQPALRHGTDRRTDRWTDRGIGNTALNTCCKCFDSLSTARTDVGRTGASNSRDRRIGCCWRQLVPRFQALSAVVNEKKEKKSRGLFIEAHSVTRVKWGPCYCQCERAGEQMSTGAMTVRWGEFRSSTKPVSSSETTHVTSSATR